MLIRQIISIIVFVGILALGGARVRAQMPESPQTQIVIIALRHSLPNEIGESARALDSRRTQIRLLQDDLVARQLASARDVWRMQTLPVVVARVDRETFVKLQQDASVSSVRASRFFAHMTSQSNAQIGARAVNAAGVTGAGTSVAILDTGVDSNHAALRGQVIQEACFSTTDEAYGSQSICADGASMQVGVGSGQPCDLAIDACNHGTHVAGIVAGRVLTHDGVTTSGVAPGTKIIAIQVFSRFAATHESATCGADATTDCVLAFEHDLLRALDWLYLNNNARMWGTLAAVNMSLGDGSYSEVCDTIGGTPEYPLKWFVDQLRLSGVATVVAAGNGGSNSGVSFPACVSSAISVGSVSSTKPAYGLRDIPSLFSNALTASANMPNVHGDRLLDFYAPGERILSSIAGGGGSAFAEYSGTSMAAPHVAGAWALIKSVRPRASVAQVSQLFTNTGVSITEPRSGFDATLVVPRIDVIGALAAIRNSQSPVSINAWAVEMGDVQSGAAMRQRVQIVYRGVPTTIRWTLSGRYMRIQPGVCAGFVDDLTPTCTFDIVFTPPNDGVDSVRTASIRLVLNTRIYTIGISGRSVARLPEVALTQTAEQRATSVALLTRTATPIAWPTPTSIHSARTLVAIATRTQRRRNELYITATQRAVFNATTATQVVAQGGPTYTPSMTVRPTKTRTPIPITQTIGAAKTTTRQSINLQTSTAYQAATRTQRSLKRATAAALSLQRTVTHIYTAGLPTLTATRRTKLTRTPTITRTSSPTQTWRPTRIPTHSYIFTNNSPLYKSYRSIVDSASGQYAVMLYAGDARISRAPELVLVNTSQQQVLMTLRLPGVDATSITSVVNKPHQFVVAGRLNWDSMYLQIYEVRGNSFALRATHVYPLPSASRVTSLYATDRRIVVGLAMLSPPATLATGQIVVFDRSTPTVITNSSRAPVTLAGVPTVIRAVDDSDVLLVAAGYVPQLTTPTGFIQSVHWQDTDYEPKTPLLRTVPVTDLTVHAVLRGLTRLHLVFAAQTQGLAILQLDETNGRLAQYQSVLQIPATKLDHHADQIAVIGFDAKRRLTVTSVYHWSVDRLILRRTITFRNRDGTIVGVSLSAAHLLFVDAGWLRFAR